MTPLTVMTRPRTQEFLVIEGGVPLTGTIRPEGNKNAALALLAAALLTAEPVVLGNMPRIRDVETMLELLADLGAEVEWTQRNEVRVCCAEVRSTALDEELSERIRASILLAGPLLARFGSADIPLPGGDVIGRRRVDSPPATGSRSAPWSGSTIDSTGTWICRSSSLRMPVSTIVHVRFGPTRNRPTSSSGDCVALRPMRWTGRSASASKRSSVRARWAPRLVWATAWISSTITHSAPVSISRACDVSMR